jgi:DNA-binding CsgD family transcriptional regulator
MATNNMRVVGYLPPHYHDKLREYMQAESITESAALVKIVKRFFDGSSGSNQVANAKLDDAIAPLKEDIAQLKRRVAVLEEASVTPRQFKSAKRTSHQYGTSPVLPPQTSSELARRLGVSAGTVEQAWQKGEAYFKDWSKRMDPAKRSWHKLGELFHPLSE